MTNVTYLALGSNVGERRANIRACIARLSALGTVVKVSSLYETEPMELREQPWFLNCVVQLETALNPEELLAGVQVIETELGRKREIEKGPRTIDVDILLFGEFVVAEANLQIPHPAMTRRSFVLEPLAEIAPDVVHPTLGKSIRELRAELDQSSGEVRRLAG